MSMGKRLLIQAHSAEDREMAGLARLAGRYDSRLRRDDLSPAKAC
jgi:hypothetical protein